jgi:hypothetical protein
LPSHLYIGPEQAILSKYSATTLASIESYSIVVGNMATALMMQTEGRFGMREKLPHKVIEAIVGVAKSRINDINSGICLQLTRKDTLKDSRQEITTLGMFKGKPTPLSGSASQICTGGCRLLHGDPLLRLSMGTHTLQNAIILPSSLSEIPFRRSRGYTCSHLP